MSRRQPTPYALYTRDQHNRASVKLIPSTQSRMHAMSLAWDHWVWADSKKPWIWAGFGSEPAPDNWEENAKKIPDAFYEYFAANYETELSKIPEGTDKETEKKRKEVCGKAILEQFLKTQ